MKSDEKNTLRIHIRKLLQSRSNEAPHSKSEQICQHLENSIYFNSLRPVLSFAALPGEPDLKALFENRKNQQPFCFPRVEGPNLEVRQVSDFNNLTLGYAGIREPDIDYCPLFPTEKLELILLPGLAFDPANGGRLGKGKGFYDRLITDMRKSSNPVMTTIGICFHWQLASVPMEPHDQAVDAIITEKGLVYSNSE